ncbi:MAG: hypothetical protein KGH56_00075 [Patescibacteria group bacterium]|nr:hypothetical protein [Patescibacteria group bacterium]
MNIHGKIPPLPILHIGGGKETDFTPSVEAFKQERGIKFVLAFSGGSEDDNPLLIETVRHTAQEFGINSGEQPERVASIVERVKDQYVSNIVRDILLPLRGYHIAVLTGGTAWGVPRIAAQTAHELGFYTIGVYPATAARKAKNMLPEGMLDLSVCVHPSIGESRWGDESAIYVKLLDAVVIIGGRAGTMVEVAHILKCNEKSDARVKSILPVSGTGGTADKVSFFPGKPETMRRSVPPEVLQDGKAVFEYLRRSNLLDDVYD